MTVINNIEIDDFEYKPNNIKNALRTRDPIEDKLHVIAVISNPCLYARRYILAQEFIERFTRDEPDTILYLVELTYPGQKYIVTDAQNPRHLQLVGQVPIWHKENMINLGVQRLLPPDWKAFAWIDADVEFDSPSWATDTLKILNGECDIVQVFSHCVDMDPHQCAMKVFNSGGFQYSKQVPYVSIGGSNAHNYWHPGYAWACTRAAYERMGGLYDLGILGSGDNIMMLSLIQNGLKAIHVDSTDGYKQSVQAFQDRVQHLRFGYVPGILRHYYHGSKYNRKYTDRWKILVNAQYDPAVYVTYNPLGVLVTTDQFPASLAEEIMNYFLERKEDDGVGPDGKYGAPLSTSSVKIELSN